MKHITGFKTFILKSDSKLCIVIGKFTHSIYYFLLQLTLRKNTKINSGIELFLKWIHL